MKIALPTANRQIDDHFGHCDYYTIYTVSGNNEIVSTDVLKSPKGCGCKSDIAKVLSDMGVKVMLAGNMGESALNLLKSHGIEVVRGCSGDVKDVAVKYLAGELRDSGEGCSSHGHECSH
ncbi:MAG: Dinitrogenase iron-molybdenum cofactor [Spirochaetes bacterium ADurb.Bin218]|jgi:predicted Fe-Mo cluster-binding NifX family protein|nr:NifB/NifX family molybdenum-iron cluster-binding protein [Spirochaetota bacterium]OQA98787.1 MAG: Dinitrogenase iron-molybdenum cofactor [Spirochaetes bacterium ADurb.Bin218]HOK02747.1 NifB/NifX family molybdenum-iron cluster-binding protein [Spirochaetota bacterium]HOK93812.1 NifB/NifX family molybdenum-iron cluster-binding protein [Spirochaetota bacterium]HOQ11722.1 NifB/NifX family molybdenum-iron cluster-binding protein [Spirochaetota bacterium]